MDKTIQKLSDHATSRKNYPLTYSIMDVFLISLSANLFVGICRTVEPCEDVLSVVSMTVQVSSESISVETHLMLLREVMFRPRCWRGVDEPTRLQLGLLDLANGQVVTAQDLTDKRKVMVSDEKKIFFVSVGMRSGELNEPKDIKLWIRRFIFFLTCIYRFSNVIVNVSGIEPQFFLLFLLIF